MKFRVTTSEVIGKIFEIEAENKDKARAGNFISPYQELVSTKTISWDIVDVEEIE